MTHIRTVWIIVGKLRKLSVATSTYTSVYQKEKMPFSLLTESNILVTPLWRNSRTDIFSNDNYRNIFIIFSRYRHADAYFLICAKLPQCQCTRLCYDAIRYDTIVKSWRVASLVHHTRQTGKKNHRNNELKINREANVFWTILTECSKAVADTLNILL